MIIKYTIIKAGIAFDMVKKLIIALKGMFKIKLAQISVFIRLSLPAELFWIHCCARHVLRGSFSIRHTKSVATPVLEYD